MTLNTRYNVPILTPPVGGLPRGSVLAPYPPRVPNLEYWYASDVAATLDVASGVLSTWRDRSGAGHNAVATGTERPASGTRSYNGKNVIDFDGSNDVMLTSAGASDITATYFFLGCIDTLTDYRGMMCGVTTGGISIYAKITTGQLMVDKAGSANLITSALTVATGTPFIACVRVNASQVIVYLNGSSQTASHSSTLTAGIAMLLGRTDGSNCFDGWMGESFKYSDDIGDAAARLQIQQLNAKWRVF